MNKNKGTSNDPSTTRTYYKYEPSILNISKNQAINQVINQATNQATNQALYNPIKFIHKKNINARLELEPTLKTQNKTQKKSIPKPIKSVIKNRRKKYTRQSQIYHLIHKLHKLSDPIVDKTSKLFLNENLFNISSIEVISNPEDTSSKSIVISILGNNKLNNKCFVIKYTSIGTYSLSIQKSNNECLLYTYLQNLIKFNICPFVYYGYAYENLVNINIMNLLNFEINNTKLLNMKLEPSTIDTFNSKTKILFLESNICDKKIKIITLKEYTKDNQNTNPDYYFNINLDKIYIVDDDYTIYVLLYGFN